MNLELKNKLQISEDYIEELVNKSWQEIETLQTQVNNLESDPVSVSLKTLIKNLLTSYYVFVGGLENLQDEFRELSNSFSTAEKEPLEEPELELEATSMTLAENNQINDNKFLIQEELSEPFEYFVDFDEPIGDPISDIDLYGTE